MSVNKKREMLVPILMFFAWVIATLLLVIAHIKGDNLIRLLGSGIYVPFMVALFSVISKATTKLLEDGVNFGPRNWQFAGRPFSEFLELYSLYVIHLFTWMSVIILGVITACVFEQYFMGTLALTFLQDVYNPAIYGLCT